VDRGIGEGESQVLVPSCILARIDLVSIPTSGKGHRQYLTLLKHELLSWVYDGTATPGG
jgi:hypothetical protein